MDSDDKALFEDAADNRFHQTMRTLIRFGALCFALFMATCALTCEPQFKVERAYWEGKAKECERHE